MVNVATFKKLEEDYLKQRDTLKKEFVNHVKKELKGYYTVKPSGYFNYPEDFHIVLILNNKKLPALSLSIEDTNHGTCEDWFSYVFIEDPAVGKKFNKLKEKINSTGVFKVTDDVLEPIFRTQDIEQAISKLKKFAEVYCDKQNSK